MTGLDEQFRAVVETIAIRFDDVDEPWALTGSASFALQGVPLSPNDVDVQTSEAGAYAIEDRFADHVVQPVRFLESPTIQSHLGEFAVDGVKVEVMGAVQTRRGDGSWRPPVDVTEHRRFVALGEIRVPVLELGYEAKAYDRLGRHERAQLLREYANR